MRMSRTCQPPAGHTYITIGQDLFSIQNYLTEQYHASLQAIAHGNWNVPKATPLEETRINDKLHPVPRQSDFLPAAFMSYTDWSGGGLDLPTDYGAGIGYADGLLQMDTDPFLSSSSASRVGLQVGLNLKGADGCQAFLNGTHQSEAEALLDYLVHSKAPKIFLRVGYEFDNPDFGFSGESGPALYQEAFRKLVRLCEQKHASCHDRIAFVWHSWGYGVSEPYDLQDFYPGDEYVDWVGVSIFAHLLPKTSSFYQPSFSTTLHETLDFAVALHKPIMIAESSPYGGIDSMADPWEDWFQPVVNLIEEYDISMWSYINCDWRAQPEWGAETPFGDSRLASNQTVMRKIHTLTQDPLSRFLPPGSLGRYCEGSTSTTAVSYLGIGGMLLGLVTVWLVRRAVGRRGQQNLRDACRISILRVRARLAHYYEGRRGDSQGQPQAIELV